MMLPVHHRFEDMHAAHSYSVLLFPIPNLFDWHMYMSEILPHESSRPSNAT